MVPTVNFSPVPTRLWNGHAKQKCSYKTVTKLRMFVVYVGKRPYTLPPLAVDGTEMRRVTEAELLAMVFFRHLSWAGVLRWTLCAKGIHAPIT